MNRMSGIKSFLCSKLLPLLLLLVVSLEVRAAPVTVRILHFNDFHGFANPLQQKNDIAVTGGAARLAEAIRRNRDVPGLLLAAGDIIQGDSWANLFRGRSSIELMNLLGVDAMSLGNHEFDFGQSQLLLLIADARFPLLAANLRGLPPVKGKTSFVRNNIRVAVIGLVTDDTPYSSHPRNTVGLSFEPPVKAARREIAEMIGKTDLIVLLTHLGHEQDLSLARMLCGSAGPVTVPLLIAGGHSHTRVEHPVKIGNCTVVQAWEHGKALGVVDYTFDNGVLLSVAGRLEEIGPSLKDGRSDVAALVGKYNREADSTLDREVANAAVDLVQQGIREQETNLGNLVADLVRETTGVQVAIINSGTLRTGINAGIVTARQVYATMPFDNYLVAVRMSGRQLLDTLEHGVSAVEKGEGRFPQVSGIRFSFRRDRPAGSRIISVHINEMPIEPDREYTVATLDFIAAGGDGYAAFGEAIRSAGDFTETGAAMRSSRLVYNDPGRFLRDIFIDSVSKRAPIESRVEGRIVEVNETK
ncbi:MAG: 5'-nucleotidase C-terminal domain-containing protein [Desulfuromonadaceae bacterium]|nr:5'-nucleotidase C-terminal domain-containing protein [Desulfuromonadaceae bacterium]